MKKKAVIFDIDGTLANNGHRQQFVRNKPKNWVAYNASMSEDKLIEPVALLFKLLVSAFNEYEIIICTGREVTYMDPTMLWLLKHNLRWDCLMMRKEKDYRDDTIVKEEMLHKLQEDGYEIVAVFDDRVKVVDMWRKNGIFVFDVNQTREAF